MVRNLAEIVTKGLLENEKSDPKFQVEHRVIMPIEIKAF